MRIIIENADNDDFNELAKLAREGKIHTFCMTDEEEWISVDEEPVKEEHEICIGDVVITPFGMKGIVIGIGENALGVWASVYLKEYDVPQMEPPNFLKYTGKHIDITNIFEQIFNRIKGDTEC